MIHVNVATDATFEQMMDTAPADFYGVNIAGTNPRTGYDYELDFYRQAESRPGTVHIATEPRGEFLAKGSEGEAQDALVHLSRRVKKLCGGVFNIHPFLGAVYNTKGETVAPGFGDSEFDQLDEHLSMSIALSNAGYKFDAESTREALAIGTTVIIPSPQGDRMLAYMQAPKTNPNQQARDQAITNNLGDRWDAEFERFNGHVRRFALSATRRAIEVTPATVMRTLLRLENEELFTSPAITTLRTVRPTTEAETAALCALFSPN